MAIFPYLKIGGHRGFGCTDEDFCQGFRALDRYPVENTADAIQIGFAAGADFVELDVMMSADDIIFLLHSVVSQPHFFEEKIPPQLLNQMKFSDIGKFNSGRLKQGTVTRFSDALSLIAAMDPHTLPWSLCVEIKGVNGSSQPYEENDFIKVLAETVKKSGFPEERILWSSFCLQNIIKISHYFPCSAYGMLFTETPFIQKVYSNKKGDPRYLEIPFEKRYIEFVLWCWHEKANKATRLRYMHPEIMTITPGKIDLLKDMDLSMNIWAYQEKWNNAFVSQYKRIIPYAREKKLPLTVITDFVEAMQKAVW